MKSKQAIFNKVWRRFVRDKAPEGTINGSCLYKGPENRQCAVGCQLPQRLYNVKMEGNPVWDLFNRYSEVKEYFGAGNLEILDQLQVAHDSATRFPDFYVRIASNLLAVASKFELKIPRN